MEKVSFGRLGEGNETASGDAAVAFVTPTTLCEHAWADLCDGVPNAEAERVLASMGGWEVLDAGPLTYPAFAAAFNRESEHADTSAAVAAKMGAGR